jgi:hypothetical protein
MPKDIVHALRLAGVAISTLAAASPQSKVAAKATVPLMPHKSVHQDECVLARLNTTP